MKKIITISANKLSTASVDAVIYALVREVGQYRKYLSHGIEISNVGISFIKNGDAELKVLSPSFDTNEADLKRAVLSFIVKRREAEQYQQDVENGLAA